MILGQSLTLSFCLLSQKLMGSLLVSYCLRVSIAMKWYHDKGNPYKAKNWTGLSYSFSRLIHYHHGWWHGGSMVALKSAGDIYGNSILFYSRKKNLGLSELLMPQCPPPSDMPPPIMIPPKLSNPFKSGVTPWWLNIQICEPLEPFLFKPLHFLTN